MNSMLGSIIVIIGLYILLWGKKKEMQNCAPKLTQEIKEEDPHLEIISNSDPSFPQRQLP